MVPIPLVPTEGVSQGSKDTSQPALWVATQLGGFQASCEERKITSELGAWLRM